MFCPVDVDVQEQIVLADHGLSKDWPAQFYFLSHFIQGLLY
jgi:hypothetical protein